MTMARVLLGFPYSANGIDVTFREAGTSADIRPDLLPGLVEAGQVSIGGRAPLGPSPVADDPPETAGSDIAGRRRR
jgi:hypothetical protein